MCRNATLYVNDSCYKISTFLQRCFATLSLIYFVKFDIEQIKLLRKRVCAGVGVGGGALFLYLFPVRGCSNGDFCLIIITFNLKN